MKKSAQRLPLVIIGICTALVIVIGLANAEYRALPGATPITLVEGKNEIIFDTTLYVNELVAQNSFIQAVSFVQEPDNNTIGYVNAFGGIGKNFLIIPGKTYEIIASQNATIKVR